MARRIAKSLALTIILTALVAVLWLCILAAIGFWLHLSVDAFNTGWNV